MIQFRKICYILSFSEFWTHNSMTVKIVTEVHFFKMKEYICRDIYQNQNNLAVNSLNLPLIAKFSQKLENINNSKKAQEQDGFGNKMKCHFHITIVHKYRFFVFCLYSSCVYLYNYDYIELVFLRALVNEQIHK